MNVVVRWMDDEYEVDVVVGGAESTIGEMASTLVGEAEVEIAVDGRRLDGSVPVAEADLRTGSVIEIAIGSDPRRFGSLVDVTAATSRDLHQLRPGVVSIGSAPADVVVAGVTGRVILHTDTSGFVSIRNPAGVAATIDGRTIGSAGLEATPGARISIGSCVLAVSAVGHETPAGPAVFNRPPRPISRRRVDELHPPAPPQESREAMRFGWASLVVPMVLGLGMAVLIHPRMAVFVLFSPAMLLANWLEDKRRVRRERRESGEVFAVALDRFRSDVATAHRAEMDQLQREALRPHDLVLRGLRLDSRLWERRPDHDDFMVVPIGSGCVPWQPNLPAPFSPEVTRIMGDFSELHDVPISVVLGAGDVTGVAGDRDLAVGLVRQVLLQAAVHHGPADLTISIFTELPDQWDWAKWLPHAQADTGRRRLAGTPEEIAGVVSLLPVADERVRRHLYVVDLPDLAAGPRALIREAIRTGETRGVATIALARRSQDLPSMATTIVSVEQAQGRIRYPDGTGSAFSPWFVGAATARQTARAIAGVKDPEAAAVGAALPGIVHLDSLLGLGTDPARSIAVKWLSAGSSSPVPIGVAADGPFLVDLISDGPHALLGGTTGAGKSELLRTLVSALACSVGPSDLNFVLVDYKGGSAFDACAALPHTVGLVTDLDEHLAKRALICLDAELRYREMRLRSAGVSAIDSYPQSAADPLPRLLVVIDEFAALAKELPEFMDALVGVAQRGRSLGVHLLLATQRPNGVISDSIKANTNLRIALRVQDVGDSVDVIGSADAAGIARTQPGRGLARRGPGEVVAFQTALVTGRSRSTVAARIVAKPFLFAHEQPAATFTAAAEEEAPSDLEVMVAAAVEAAAKLGVGPVRLPWPDALPEAAYLDGLLQQSHEFGSAPFGIADEPHLQRQIAAVWSPVAGNLLLYGLPGSGTTTTLATLALSLAANSDPDRTHIYVLDFDDQLLHPLQGLPHVGAVIGGNDRERQLRLLRRLAGELHERRLAASIRPEATSAYPVIVTFLDNYGSFADSYRDPGDAAVHNLVGRLVADGPGVGMTTVITAKQAGDIPTRVASLVSSRLVFRLADRYDYSGLGVPAVSPPTTAGRAFESGTGREVQVVLAHRRGLAAAVTNEKRRPTCHPPWSIDVLPSEVGIAEFLSAGRISPDGWFLPLGIGDSSLAPVGLLLRDGDHALVTGPPRSGKTTALATIATVAKSADSGLHVVAVLPRRSPLSECDAVDEFIELDDLSRFADLDGSCLLLIDDAEFVEADIALRPLINDRDPRVRVVASGAVEAIRSLYGHWTQDLRRSRIGCALRPTTVADGDLWQTQLPRDPQQPFPAGRGYLLADGQAELVQLGRA